MLLLYLLVSTLKDQLEDLKKVSQNSQLASEKLAQLQKQVSFWNVIFFKKIIINKFVFWSKNYFLFFFFK